jgi:exoribonuclease-2
MILANHLVAKHLQQEELPLIYKLQDKPVEMATGKGVFLKKSKLSTIPGQHYGLALDIYTQFTSPIRRYNDLIIHRQIKHWLREGQSFYTLEQLEELIALSDQALHIAHVTQRESYRYWFYKYLQQLEEPLLMAEVTELLDDRIAVYLPEYCVDSFFYPPLGTHFQVGDQLLLEIEQVHPRRGLFHLRYHSNL